MQPRTVLETLLALLGELLELLFLRRELGLVRLCGALLVLIFGHGPRVARNPAPAEPGSPYHATSGTPMPPGGQHRERTTIKDRSGAGQSLISGSDSIDLVEEGSIHAQSEAILGQNRQELR